MKTCEKETNIKIRVQILECNREKYRNNNNNFQMKIDFASRVII